MCCLAEELVRVFMGREWMKVKRVWGLYCLGVWKVRVYWIGDRSRSGPGSACICGNATGFFEFKGWGKKLLLFNSRKSFVRLPTIFFFSALGLAPTPLLGLFNYGPQRNQCLLLPTAFSTPRVSTLALNLIGFLFLVKKYWI